VGGIGAGVLIATVPYLLYAPGLELLARVVNVGASVVRDLWRDPGYSAHLADRTII
jgi:hypothetical protein